MKKCLVSLGTSKEVAIAEYLGDNAGVLVCNDVSALLLADREEKERTHEAISESRAAAAALEAAPSACVAAADAKAGGIDEAIEVRPLSIRQWRAELMEREIDAVGYSRVDVKNVISVLQNHFNQNMCRSIDQAEDSSSFSVELAGGNDRDETADKQKKKNDVNAAAVIQNSAGASERLKYWGNDVDVSIAKLMKRELTVPIKLVRQFGTDGDATTDDGNEAKVDAAEEASANGVPNDAAGADGNAACADATSIAGSAMESEADQSVGTKYDIDNTEDVIYFYLDGSSSLNIESSDCCINFFIAPLVLQKTKKKEDKVPLSVTVFGTAVSTKQNP